MKEFKSELFFCVIVIILIGFFISMSRMIRNRLERLGPQHVPVRHSPKAGTDETGKSKGFFRFWFGELKSNYQIIGQICSRIVGRATLLSAIGDMILVIGFSVAMVAFCTYSEGGVDLYMTTFMTMMYVMFALILFARCVDGSRKIYLPCCLMILCSVALAVLLYLSPMAAIPANLIGPPSDTVQFQVIAIILGLVAFPLIRMICRTERRITVLVILNLLIICLYAALFIFGKEINGARNWIIIGGFSIQVSEITKVLSVASFSLALTCEQMVEKKPEKKPDEKQPKWYKRKLMWTSFTMAINGGFLLVCNEFGTLMLLCAVYVVMGVIYLKNLRPLINTIVAATIVAACGLAICGYCYSITPQKPVQKITTVAAAGEEFVYKKENVNPPAETEEMKVQEPTGEVPLYVKAGKIYKKYLDRVQIFTDRENVDMQKEGYQWKKAREALALSDWLGSPYDVAVPVARSDFIFNYLMVRMGVAFGFIVLLLLLYMLCEGTILCLRNPFVGEASVSLAFLFAIVIQSVIAAASSTGLFIIVGIPFAFLAYGGSATMMNYAMLIFIIYATRANPSDFRIPHGRNVISYKER